ncbi:MAG: hypothetical protein ACLP8B_24700, partial [Xanthobacteraceae bacterium]
MIRRALYIALVGVALLGKAEALIVLPPVITDSEFNLSKLEMQTAQSDPSSKQNDLQSAQSKSPPVQGSPPESRQAESAPIGNPLWAIPLGQLSVTRDRPLFSPVRRRPAPAVANVVVAPPPPAPKPAAPERPQLALVGTIIGTTDKLCVFLDQTTKVAVRLRMGESHQGWTLTSVEPREATVQKDQATVVIGLPAPGERATTLATLGAAPNPPLSPSPAPLPSGSTPPTVQVSAPAPP